MRIQDQQTSSKISSEEIFNLINTKKSILLLTILKRSKSYDLLIYLEETIEPSKIKRICIVSPKPILKT